MSESLEDIINGNEATEEPAEQQVEQPTEAEPVQANADDSTEVETTGEKEASTPDADNDPVKGLQAGIVEERRKRQEAEKRIEQYEQYLRSQQQGQQPNKPDFWEAPEEYLSQYARSLQGQFQQNLTNLSVDMMRSTHDDYDEMEAKFTEMAEQNPALIQQLRQSGNPARFAYETAKSEVQRQQLSDPNYLEKMKAEWIAEYEASKKAQVEQEVQKRTLPGSLSTERAAGGSSNRNTGHESLNEILGR